MPPTAQEHQYVSQTCRTRDVAFALPSWAQGKRATFKAPKGAFFFGRDL